MSQLNDYTIKSDQDETGTKLIIDGLTEKLFSAFTNKGRSTISLDVIREIFIPEGLIVKNAGNSCEIYDLDRFIKPREDLLNGGTLVDFEEEELTEQTMITGNIAHRVCVYHKKGILSGKAFYTKGVKNIQFIKTVNGWKINSLAWDDEREGLVIL